MGLGDIVYKQKKNHTSLSSKAFIAKWNMASNNTTVNSSLVANAENAKGIDINILWVKMVLVIVIILFNMLCIIAAFKEKNIFKKTFRNYGNLSQHQRRSIRRELRYPVCSRYLHPSHWDNCIWIVLLEIYFCSRHCFIFDAPDPLDLHWTIPSNVSVIQQPL